MTCNMVWMVEKETSSTLASRSCTCLTVHRPCCQSTCRISSSRSVGPVVGLRAMAPPLGDDRRVGERIRCCQLENWVNPRGRLRSRRTRAGLDGSDLGRNYLPAVMPNMLPPLRDLAHGLDPDLDVLVGVILEHGAGGGFGLYAAGAQRQVGHEEKRADRHLAGEAHGEERGRLHVYA